MDGWRSLVDYNPWVPKESDTTERLRFHIHPLDELFRLGELVSLYVKWGSMLLCQVYRFYDRDNNG